MTLTEHFDMKQNSQTYHVGYFWFCSYKHFQFLLFNTCPGKRIFICKKTKEIITLHFQHLLFLLKWSFVYEYTLQKIVIQRFCLDLPRLEGNTFSCETVEEAANSLFRCKFV